MKELTSKEAAIYLGYSEYTLRKSRGVGGKIAGVNGPVFKRCGTRIRYTIESLDKWLDQFNGDE